MRKGNNVQIRHEKINFRGHRHLRHHRGAIRRTDSRVGTSKIFEKLFHLPNFTNLLKIIRLEI